jgi:hypothetical protein
MDTGYYRVNNKLFSDKIEAILFANSTLADITWHFHDEIFNSLNWTIEPSLELRTLYKLRASQLREKYDYIVAMASGGADSTNMIYSFLHNNISLDEIVIGAPLSGLRDWTPKHDIVAPENTISETKLTQLPLMNTISSLYPNVKITLNDYFEDMLTYKTDDWLYKSSDFIHPTTVARFSLEKFKHIKDIAENGKKICVLYGIDKPFLYLKDNHIGVFISDLTVNTQRPAFNLQYPNVSNELFYYTPDLPELLIKQAHVVAKWIHLKENIHIKSLLPVATGPTKDNTKNLILYQRSIIPCIYPGTVMPVFQSFKPTKPFMAEHDYWFYKHHSNTKVYQMIESDMHLFLSNINVKYLRANKSGFVNYVKSWKIGEAINFSSAS